jgi:alpha-tubulin suppressor-like RCC1 family protein
MSTKYSGGVIKSSPVVPAGSYQNSSASGVWTMEQAGYWIKQGNWPTAGAVSSLWSWGRNNQGQLGLGNATSYSSPKQVGTLLSWSGVSIHSQGNSVLSVKPDGTLWAWGMNAFGQLGLGNTTYYSSPKQVGALTTWSTITEGLYHSIAIKTDGTLWSWGYNNNGQLGLGNVTYYSSPKQVGALTTWLNIAAGNGVTFATKTDGTLWSWGYNGSGGLGLGNTTNYSSPKQVGALTNWLGASIAAGGATLVIKPNGTFWAWGTYNAGQLPLNAIAAYSSPKQVGALTNWLIVSAGLYHAGAVKSNGTLWTWGQGTNGALGLGNTTSYSSPKQVGALTTWYKVSCGRKFTLTTKTDGTLWTWGQNNYGQLGLGNITDYSSPKQVGALTTWLNIAGGSYSTLATKA